MNQSVTKSGVKMAGAPMINLILKTDNIIVVFCTFKY